MKTWSAVVMVVSGVLLALAGVWWMHPPTAVVLAGASLAAAGLLARVDDA